MNKILAICTSPDKGGLELYFIKLVNHYHNSTKNIFSICKKDSYICKNVKSPLFGLGKISILNIFINIYKIIKIIKTHNIDIIHVSWTKDLFFAVLIKMFSKKKIKIVYYRQMKITRNKKDFYHKFIYENIDLVIVITQNLLNDCKKYLSINPQRIKKLTYGITKPSGKKSIIKTDFFKDINFNINYFTIGVFSRIEEQKGQHLVIESINELSKYNIQLLLIGHCMNQDYLNHLMSLVTKYSLTNRVKVMSFTKKPMEIMSVLDTVILPTYEETFGLVMAESMLMGTPVIGSDAGGVPEIITHEENGLLFKTKDYHSLSNNIEKLYCSKDLRKKLSINADIFATERYNYDNHFKRLQELISNL